MACEAWRLDLATLRELPRTRVSPLVRHFVGWARRRRIRAVSKRAHRSRGGTADTCHVPDLVTTLVRVIPELAERISRDCVHGVARSVPAATCVTRVETCPRTARRDRALIVRV